MRTPFFGPYSVSRSTNLADNHCTNLYPELVEGQTNSKDRGALYMTPGLQLLATIGSGPIWGGIVVNNLLYLVSGRVAYIVHPDFTFSALGNIGSTGPVTTTYNGTQVGFFTGPQTPQLWAYTISTAAFAQVSLPFTPSGAAVTVDGFTLAAQQNSALMFQSNLLDLTTWNALSFGEASGNMDPIVTLATMNREVFVFKNTATEVWVDVGSFPFAFARLDGVYIEAGAAAANCVSQLGDSLVFVNQNKQGNATILQLRGYTPQSMSTHALEIVLQKYPTLTDLISYSYQQDGHHWYVLSSPSGNATWVLDATTSQRAKEPMWHHRAAFSQGNFSRHPGQFQVFFNGINVIGDYQTGNLYQYVPGLATDNGAQRKWRRTWRALARPTDQPTRFTSLRIDMQTGIGVPDGTDPLVVLKYSDDGGHNWSREKYAHAGQPGETARRVMFRNLGSTKRHTGLDRIFELSSTDIFPAAIIGAELT